MRRATGGRRRTKHTKCRRKAAASDSEGYGYCRFCDLCGGWRHGVTATMRQTHAAGEKRFVDFVGDTVATANEVIE
jgi:transposase